MRTLHARRHRQRVRCACETQWHACIMHKAPHGPSPKNRPCAWAAAGAASTPCEVHVRMWTGGKQPVAGQQQLGQRAGSWQA